MVLLKGWNEVGRTWGKSTKMRQPSMGNHNEGARALECADPGRISALLPSCVAGQITFPLWASVFWSVKEGSQGLLRVENEVKWHNTLKALSTVVRVEQKWWLLFRYHYGWQKVISDATSEVIIAVPNLSPNIQMQSFPLSHSSSTFFYSLLFLFHCLCHW